MMSQTPARSKIEFAAHVIKNLSQITLFHIRIGNRRFFFVYELYDVASAAVAGGSVNPPAQLCVRKICTLINNVMYIKYIKHFFF